VWTPPEYAANEGLLISWVVHDGADRAAVGITTASGRDVYIV